MKNLQTINNPLWAFLFATLFGLSLPLNAATYTLTFTGVWNSSHVENNVLPQSAHFTSLIGATHQSGQPLWSPGSLASKGIENVAEQGDNLELRNEINTAIAAGSARDRVTANGIFRFPSSSSTTLEIFDSHSSVSFISMVAPTPDWFVGVSDVSLKKNGSWINKLSLDLRPWDAGTEEGSSFSLANPPTIPQQGIAPINGSPFVGSPVIGNLTLELVPVPLPGTLVLFLTGFFGLLWRWK